MVSIYNLTAISVYRWVVFKEKVINKRGAIIGLYWPIITAL